METATERAADVFGGTTVAEPPVDLKVLHAKIGQLTLENDFLEGALNKGIVERKAMIDGSHALSISHQAQLAGISRSSVYYLPKPVNLSVLMLMRRIDELHLEYPFMGARMLRDQLNREGYDVGRKHVGTLMKRMGIEALYRKPGTSKKHPDMRFILTCCGAWTSIGPTRFGHWTRPTSQWLKASSTLPPSWIGPRGVSWQQR